MTAEDEGTGVRAADLRRLQIHKPRQRRGRVGASIGAAGMQTGAIITSAKARI
jgi:hypothetical protein